MNIEGMTIDLQKQPSVGDIVLNKPMNDNGVPDGSGVAYLDGGLSFAFEDANWWFSKAMFFIPIVDDIVTQSRNIAEASIMMVGCLDPRKARKYRQQLAAAADGLAQALPGPDPESTGFPYMSYPESIEADEAARAASEDMFRKAAKAGDRAALSALKAAGLA